MKNKKQLPPEQASALLSILKNRFDKHPDRHKGISWNAVQQKLEASPEKLWVLEQMEETGGEPDVVVYDKATGEYVFYDCAPESPKGRRSTCFDSEAWEARKEHKPENNAVGMAAEMGIDMLDEEQYRYLQTLGNFDAKTSSWIQTPAPIRKLGGALFADYRYDSVFVYHNGAQSYYAARGFRGLVKV